MRVLAFSGGKDSCACLHLLAGELDAAIYVDTGFAYQETRAVVEYAASLVPMHIVRSDRSAQNEAEGIPADVVPVDWTRFGEAVTGAKPYRVQDYHRCCFENIALPLIQKAKALGATRLYYGQRADDGHRATAKSGDTVDGIERVHPIEGWTEAMVRDFLETKMAVPEHFRIRHSSLDCYDCTAYGRESADRVQWTAEKYPAFHAAYAKRAALVREAILGSL